MPTEGITDGPQDFEVTDDYIIIDESGRFLAVEGRGFVSYEDPEFFITSEIYPVLVFDSFSAEGSINEDLVAYMFGPVDDSFLMTGSMQGNHELLSVRQDHVLYDTDIFDVSAAMQGNHNLLVVRVDHDLYDTDVFDVAASMQGNHSLDVVRIDHDLYDTDIFDVAASMQGNHTLS